MRFLPNRQAGACMVLGVLVWMLTSGALAIASVYTDSAHGNHDPPSGYGVNRAGTGYDIGACTHCHDTFDKTICGTNDLMLFETAYFCVQCHVYPGNSYQEDMPYQGCYSYKFGGDPNLTCPSSIKSAFLFINQSTGQPVSNCGSSNGSAHYLEDIRIFLENRWGFGDTADDINLCEGCHNPHRAQRHEYPLGSQGTSPISRPSAHAGDWDVYGADPSERMDNYASPETYVAPRYYYNTGGYEPDGGAQQNGGNIPDYVTFCTDCHNNSNDIWSTPLERDLHKFDWATEKHGRGAATDAGDYDDFLYYGSPYRDDQSGSYVMSCMDCHEAHGSSNSYLARATVNGAAAELIKGSLNDWRDWCRRCHDDMGHFPGPHSSYYNSYCSTCHPTTPQGVGYNCYSTTYGCHRHGSAFGGL
jgi:hypothetical protein